MNCNYAMFFWLIWMLASTFFSFQIAPFNSTLYIFINTICVKYRERERKIDVSKVTRQMSSTFFGRSKSRLTKQFLNWSYNFFFGIVPNIFRHKMQSKDNNDSRTHEERQKHVWEMDSWRLATMLMTCSASKIIWKRHLDASKTHL